MSESAFRAEANSCPVWRLGINGMNYVFIAVPQKSDVYACICARYMGDGQVKVKFYPHPGVFFPKDHPYHQKLGSNLTGGSGPYYRGMFSRHEIDELFAMLKESPASPLMIAPVNAEGLIDVLSKRLGNGDDGDGMGLHPPTNGNANPDELSSMLRSRRNRSKSFVEFGETSDA